MDGAPALLAVPGVAKVVVFGGDTRSIQIQIHPDQLIRYNLSIDDVLAAARRATGMRGAGFVDTENQRIVFQTEGQSLQASDIARTVLVSAGARAWRSPTSPTSSRRRSRRSAGSDRRQARRHLLRLGAVRRQHGGGDESGRGGLA